MGKRRNGGEGGVAEQNVTVGNSGGVSGDPFDAVTALLYSSAHAAHGGFGFRAPTGASAGQVRWAVSGTALAIRIYVWQSAAVTGDSGLIQASHTTDTTSFSAYLQSTNRLRLSCKGVSNVWTAPSSFPTEQVVRIDMYGTIGTTNANGTLRAAYYLGDSLTAIADSGTLTGLNMGGDLGAFTQVRIGKLITTASPLWEFDDLAVDFGTDAVGFIGPPSNNPPSVTLPLRQVVTAGSTITMPVTASDTDGTVTSIVTSVVRLTRGAAPATVLDGGTGANPTWTASSVPAVDQVITTVTDNNGATTTATTEYVVVQSGDFGVLNGGGTGVWSNVGGAANTGAAVADANASTFAESPDQSATESEQRFRLEPLDARQILQFKPQSQLSLLQGTNTFRVYNGNTKIAEWTIPQSLSVVTNGAASSGSDRWTVDASNIPAGAPLYIAWATVS